jgi:NitT/TauT family transport system ATP-binding protein
VDVVHRFGSAVLLVTHDIDEALRVADRVLLMGHGRLVREWPNTTREPPAQAALHDEIHAALHSLQRGSS